MDIKGEGGARNSARLTPVELVVARAARHASEATIEGKKRDAHLNELVAVGRASARDFDRLTIGPVNGPVAITRPCRIDVRSVAKRRRKSVNLLKGEAVEAPVLALHGGQWRSDSRRDKGSKTDRVNEFHSFTDIPFF